MSLPHTAIVYPSKCADFQIFHRTDWQTDWLTDKLDRHALRACPRGVTRHILWSRWSCKTSRTAFGRCGSLSVHAWFLVTSLGLEQVAEVLTHTMFKYLTLYYYSSGNCFSSVWCQSPITQCSAQHARGVWGIWTVYLTTSDVCSTSVGIGKLILSLFDQIMLLI